MRSLVVIGFLLSLTVASTVETLTFVEHADSDVELASSDTYGHGLIFANPVFDEDNQIKVGTDQGYCVRTVVGKAWECFWTIMLADGQLSVHGPFYDDRNSILLITGGSGKYLGAFGTMELQHRPSGSEYLFVYQVQTQSGMNGTEVLLLIWTVVLSVVVAVLSVKTYRSQLGELGGAIRTKPTYNTMRPEEE